MLYVIILTIHIVIAISLIILVLLQQGKGSDVGAAFGGGSSGSLFGARGSYSFFFKLTAGFAIAFLVTSITLALLATRSNESSSVLTSSVLSSEEFSSPTSDEFPEIEQESDSKLPSSY